MGRFHSRYHSLRGCSNALLALRTGQHRALGRMGISSFPGRQAVKSQRRSWFALLATRSACLSQLHKLWILFRISYLKHSNVLVKAATLLRHIASINGQSLLCVSLYNSIHGVSGDRWFDVFAVFPDAVQNHVTFRHGQSSACISP